MIRLIEGDCTQEHQKIEDGSIDLILTDLPYGTVKSMVKSTHVLHGMLGKTGWDSVIEIDAVYKIADRVLRKNGKMVLFAQQPFTTTLISSQSASLPFLYSMVWKKDHFANSLIAKKAPVSYYEDVLVFSKSHDSEGVHPLRPYFKEILSFIGLKKREIINACGQGLDHCFRVDSSQFSLCTEKSYNLLINKFNINEWGGFIDYADLKRENERYNSVFNLWEGKRYKSNILEYKKDYGGHHPAQKPVLLLEDLIKTFSNEGDIVLDLTMGSGSTGVACVNTGRSFIGIELDKTYYSIAESRVLSSG